MAVLREFPKNVAGDGESPSKIFLYIHGPIGVGKTTLAVAALRSWTEQGYADKPLYEGSHCDIVDAKFQEVGALLKSIQATFGGDPEGEREITSRCCGVKVLLLDDLGQEKQSDWSMTVLYEIFNQRYNNRAPTIVTSNLSPEALKEWDARVASRALSGVIIGLTGKDKRPLMGTRNEIPPEKAKAYGVRARQSLLDAGIEESKLTPGMIHARARILWLSEKRF